MRFQQRSDKTVCRTSCERKKATHRCSGTFDNYPRPRLHKQSGWCEPVRAPPALYPAQNLEALLVRPWHPPAATLHKQLQNGGVVHEIHELPAHTSSRLGGANRRLRGTTFGSISGSKSCRHPPDNDCSHGPLDSPPAKASEASRKTPHPRRTGTSPMAGNRSSVAVRCLADASSKTSTWLLAPLTVPTF